MYRFERYNLLEMKEMIKQFKVIRNKEGRFVFDGFRFFSPMSILRRIREVSEEECKCDYVSIAFDDVKPVGVVCIRKVEEKAWSYYLLDTHKDYLRKGVTTGLYKFVGSWLEPGVALFRQGPTTIPQPLLQKIFQLRKDSMPHVFHFESEEEFLEAKRKGFI